MTVLYCRSDVTDIYLKEKEQLRITEEALEMAKRASNAKSEFLSRMSHDIRTPMNTIVNLTKMAREEIDHKELVLEDLKKIETANQFLMSLINDILDMARIEQKNFDLHVERYGYQEFKNYLISTFRPLAEEKQIQLTIEEDREGVDILIDKVRFNQMCFNLVSNAIKYTPEGGHVCFKMVHGMFHNGRFPCDIYVIDDGIGMSESFQKEMFAPFAQEGRAYKTVEGTGLGLAIVKEIISLLNGTIEVESAEGKGTTFHVHIEMVQAEKMDEKSGRLQVEYERFQGKHVLIVEDHPLNQEIARRLLEKVKVQVQIAEDGQKALDLLCKNPETWDAVLMDMRMPVLDGIQATRKIRKLSNEKVNRIPIIAMTANAFETDHEEALAAGMDAFLSKPVEPAKLYLTLQKFL